MTSKQGYNPDFSEYLDKKIMVKITDDRKIGGTVSAIDHFMNMVIDDAFEYQEKEGTKIPLYKTIIRGSNIVSWELLQK